MNTESLVSMAMLIAGILAIIFGIRILIRSRAKIQFRSSQPTRPDFVLKLAEGPARLWGACVTVIGLRVIWATLPVVLGRADPSTASAGGWVTGLALTGLIVAAIWQGLKRFRQAVESPETQQKIWNKAHEASPGEQNSDKESQTQIDA